MANSFSKKLKTALKDRAAAFIARRVMPRLFQDNRYFDLFEQHGLHVTPVHFYSPVPDVREVSEEFWERESKLNGLELRPEHQLELLEEFSRNFPEELSTIPVAKPECETEYYYGHGEFSVVDADFLYCLLRKLKPARFLEVGSGFSTLLAAKALAKNREDGFPCEQSAIDPYPRDFLVSGELDLSELVQKRVQDVPLQSFAKLKDGDVLFIDSSHVLKTGSDVQYEFMEILPSLASGVYVHFHDIFWPAEYPREWLCRRRMFWNEQYLLQAFMSFNNSFEIVWTGQYMQRRYPEKIREAFPAANIIDPNPGSVWLRRKC